MQSPSQRRRQEARRDLAIAGLVFASIAAAVIAGLWVAGKTGAVGPFACAGYEFQRAEWREAGPVKRRREARLITRCNYLDGKTRRQVRSDLGGPERGASSRREWRFFLGNPNEYLRLGDSRYLIVRFGGRRVTSAELPED